MTFDWKSKKEYSTNVNFYEHTRSPMRRTSRSKLVVSAKRRFKTLVAAGYSEEDIEEAILAVTKAKSERTDSLSSGRNGPLDAFMDMVDVGKKGSKAIFEGVTVIIGIRRTALRRKCLGNPAC